MPDSRLKEHYNKVSKKQLKTHFKFRNDMQIPKLEKISVNMSVKDAVTDSKIINKVYDEIMIITGQKPVMTKAKKSISSFKLRQGVKIGCPEETAYQNGWINNKQLKKIVTKNIGNQYSDYLKSIVQKNS